MDTRLSQLPDAAPVPLAVLSPELALVDPELAAAARAALPDPVATQYAAVVQKRTRPEFEPEPDSPGLEPHATTARFRAGLRFRAATRARRAAAGRAITVGALVAVALGAVAQASAPAEVSPRAAAMGQVPKVAFGADASTGAGQDPRRAQGGRAVPTPARAATAEPTSAPSGSPAAPAPARRAAPVPKAADGAANEGNPARPPHAEPGATPEAVAEHAIEPAVAPPVLMWPPVSGAAAYRVELYRGGSRILARVTRPPKIALAASWRYGGQRRDLFPGRYEWIVYPLRRRGSVLIQAEAVIRSQWLLAP